MEITFIITGFCFIVWFALYNGFTLRWAWESDAAKKQKLSKLWHQFGTLVRVCPIPFIVYYFIQNLFLMAVLLAWYAVFLWPLFDIILNLSRGLNWNYKGSGKTGTGSLIDILLSDTMHWILKCLIIASAVAITIIYMV